jgi:hypothetical protein
MRPTYETDETRAREAKIALRCVSLWGVAFQKLPISYRLDYALTTLDGRAILGFCEIKTRETLAGEHPTYKVSASKWLEARRWYVLAKLRTVLVVQHLDIAVWYDLAEMYPRFEMWGRSDRGDSQDREPALVIPSSFASPLDRVPSCMFQRVGP